jgi:cytochrome c-type biogenesis protein CcmF
MMFTFAAFVVTVIGQELARGVAARRAMVPESPARALLSLVRRNRRRYGGYTVHVGMAVLFVGVAASTAFQHARDVRLSPKQTASVGGYQVTYKNATARADYRGQRLERVALGAVLDVRRDGRHVTTLRTERGYYPSAAPMASGSLVRGIFEGNATSEVGMKAGVTRDLWTAIRPDPEYLNKVIDALADKTKGRPPAQQAEAVGNLLRVYQQGAFPAQFRIISSPLVTWIWVGGLIVFGGGLIALWPAPDASRRRVTAGYAGRVARDLGRA